MKKHTHHRLSRGPLRTLLPVVALCLPLLAAGCGNKEKSSKASESASSSSSKADDGKGAPKADLMEAMTPSPRKRAAAPKASRAGEFVKKMLALMDQACKCKDRACGLKVLATLSNLKKTYGAIRLPRAQNRMLQKKSYAFGRCLGQRGVKPAEIMQALK